MYAVPLFLILEAINISSRQRDWASDWLWTSSYAGGILVLLGPLAAGVAAAESVQLRRRKGDALFHMHGVHESRFHIVRLTALGVWVGLSHLIGVLVMWVIAIQRHGQWGWLDPRVVLPSFLLLLAFVSIGAAAGWWLPKVVTPPLVALAGYVLPGLGVMQPALFLVGGATGSLIGLEYRQDLLWAQSAWWLALAVVGLLALGQWSRLRLSSFAVVMGIAGLCGGSVMALGPDDLRPVDRLPALACSGSKPQVCVSAEVPASLIPVAKVARPLSAALAVLLPGKPVDRIVTVQAAHMPIGTVFVPADPNPPYVEDLSVSASLVRAKTGCALDDNAANDSMFGAARYLLTQVPTGSAPPFPQPVPTADQAKALIIDLQRRCGG